MRSPAAALAMLGGAVLLSGCMGMPQMMMASAPPPPPPPPVEMAPPPPPMMEVILPTPGIMDAARLRLAINMLTQGDAPHAEAELKAYLVAFPNSVPGRNLLAQIQTPIEMLYPAESFTVAIGPNDTMSTLAGIYMGDSLSFYGLARYNNIPNPSRITAGQNIKIPRTPDTEAALMAREQMAAQMAAMGMMMPLPPTMDMPMPASNTPPARPGDPWVSINADVAAMRYEAAIRTAETSMVMPNPMQSATLARAYSSNAQALRMTDAMAAEAQAVRAGQLYLEGADRPEEAIAPLSLALELNAMDMEAQMLLGLAKSRAADGYYRQGLVAFQRQDLTGAIAAWDKTLAIDPDHKNAQLQRAQAVELQQNLQNLNPAAPR